MQLSMILAFIGTVLLHSTATRAPKSRGWQTWLASHPQGARAVGLLSWMLGWIHASAADGVGVGLTVVSVTTMLTLPALSLTAPFWPKWSWRTAPIAASVAMFVALWGWL